MVWELPLRTVLLLELVDLRDSLDICFTVSAVFVNGHRYA